MADWIGADKVKRTVPLSAIRDTPVSARRTGEPTEPIKPPEDQVPVAHRSRRYPPKQRAAEPVSGWMCVIPGCIKRLTLMPHLRLCSAHLVIIHNAVAADTDGLIGIVVRRLDELPDFAPPPRAMPTNGVVYFLQIGGHIKIGWTSDLTKRMHGYPPNTDLLAVHPGTRADELRLHKMFAVHRSHGREWYPLAPVILAHIKRVTTEHGKPVDMTFGAKPVEVPQPRQHQYVGGEGRGRSSTPRMVRG